MTISGRRAKRVLAGAIAVLALLIAIPVATVMIFNYALRCEHWDFENKFHKKLAANNEHFYMCDGHVYAQDRNRTYFRLTDYDAESFQVLPYLYAKDKNSVYSMALLADPLFGTGNEVRKIEGADPASFEVLSDKISRDKNYEYRLFGYHEIRRTPRKR
jgi:hypothetical protein